MDLVAQAHASRWRSLEREGGFARFRLPDRHAEQRIVYVLVTPAPLCAGRGGADPRAARPWTATCGLWRRRQDRILAKRRAPRLSHPGLDEGLLALDAARFDLGFAHESSGGTSPAARRPSRDRRTACGVRGRVPRPRRELFVVFLHNGRTGRTLRRVQAGGACRRRALPGRAGALAEVGARRGDDLDGGRVSGRRRAARPTRSRRCADSPPRAWFSATLFCKAGRRRLRGEIGDEVDAERNRTAPLARSGRW